MMLNLKKPIVWSVPIVAKLQGLYLLLPILNESLNSVPCTFLDQDNKCFIYEVRPKACREFPHTDRKKFQQISNLTLKNVAICPAAFNIVEKMKEKLPL